MRGDHVCMREKDEVFRDPVAVTNFGIPMTRKNDGEKEGDEADDVSKVKFLSEVARSYHRIG